MKHDGKAIKKGHAAQPCKADSLPDRQQSKGIQKAANPFHDTALLALHEYIYSNLLPTGKGSGVSMGALANSLMISTRACRRIISDMRKQGYLICGDKHGYYKPADNPEAYRQYKAMHKRAMSALTSLKALNKALKGNGITLPEDQLFAEDQGRGVSDQDKFQEETEVIYSNGTKTNDV